MTPRLKRISDKIDPEIPSSHPFRANLPPKLRGLARRIDQTVPLSVERGVIQSNAGSNTTPYCPADASQDSKDFTSPLTNTTRTNILTPERPSKARKSISRSKFKTKSASKSTTTKTPKQKLIQPPATRASTMAKLRAEAIEVRKGQLLNHPLIVPGSLTSTQAQCARCGHTQQLDKRRSYSYSNMRQHWKRESCKNAAAR
jgi:hypothetical protein